MRPSEKASNRRILLRALIGGLSLAGLFGRNAQAAKVSQASVGYQNSPRGSQSCASCRLFVAPNACMQVDGVISPNGSCRIWQKAG